MLTAAGRAVVGLIRLLAWIIRADDLIDKWDVARSNANL